MILGFKPRFVAPILAGTKIHTIRDDPHNRWKAGRGIQIASGVRTKNYVQFYYGVCKSTQKIEIKYVDKFWVKILIDGKDLPTSRYELLAHNDGFNSIQDFYKWFDKDFTGKIIHWMDFKY